jgi:serine/threonine-protein kinase
MFASGSAAETPYLVMELLEGHDLGWHLRRNGRLDLELVVEMCEQVARALADVRAAGIVHRDLKPANLFLTDSLPRTWKVLDFGLSKILDDTATLTRDQAVGTPAYMAPEQVRGPKVDHLTDLYALAAIAYRALTGIPPFSGDQVAHVLYRVVYQQPACPGDLVRVPIDIELVLAIGMAKKPSDRFARVEELAAAMRAAYQGRLDDDVRGRGWALVKAMPWGSMVKPSRSAA